MSWARSVAALVCVAGCSQNTAVDPAALIKVPHRADTAGDALMAFAPAGADALVELDIARLRANPVVGRVVVRASGIPVGAAPVALDFTVLDRADAIALLAYNAGDRDAAMLTILRGPGVTEYERAAAFSWRIDDRTVALGPPELLERVAEVIAGTEPAVTTDRRLMAARTRAMPAKAEGASIRVAARLDFDARVSLAGQLDLDEVPREFSVWGDVVDDLAIVAVLDSADDAEAERVSRGLVRARSRAIQHPWIRARFLHFALHNIDITLLRSQVRAVLVIGPRQLRFMIRRLINALPPEVSPS